MRSPSFSEKSKSKLVVRILIVLVCFFTASMLQLFLKKKEQEQQDLFNNNHQEHSLVALAPSIVEIIYELNLEKQLVGVSRFCKYPEDVSNKKIVGGYLDLNLEKLIALKPSCVVLLEEQDQLARKLKKIGIPSLALDHASLTGITRSITLLGDYFQKQENAKKITSRINKRIEKIKKNRRSKNANLKVLICLDHDTSTPFPQSIVIAGNKGVHQEFITLAGSKNAYLGGIPFPIISRENLIHMNPDIIIDLIREDFWNKKGSAPLQKQWSQLSELKAVRNKKIYFLWENKHMIPGPRFMDTAEEIFQIINHH